MKTPLLTSILLAMTVYCLVSCGSKNGTDRAGKGPATAVPTSEASNPQGTSDQGGGGNLIDGKPIDFYAIDITTLDEYKTYIVPIDRRIRDVLAGPDTQYQATYLETLAKSKTWYLIPAPLEQLQKERIGTNFQSDQGAFQTDKEIFLSAPVLKTMSSENRGKLILHELVMAFFRVKFQDMSFYCKAQGPRLLEECLSAIASANNDPRARAEVRAEFLKPEEYESIRSVTQWLYQNFKTITREEFYQTLKEKNFDPRVYNASSVQEQRPQTTPPIEREDFLQQLEQQKKTGYLPSHCGFDKSAPPTAEATCDVSWEVAGEALNLKIVLKRGDQVLESKSFELGFPKRYSHHQSGYNRRRESFRDGLAVDIVELSSNTPAVQDGIRYGIEFLTLPSSKSTFHLVGFRLKKSLWTKAEANGSSLAGFKTSDMAMTENEKQMSFIYGQKTAPVRAEELSYDPL